MNIMDWQLRFGQKLQINFSPGVKIAENAKETQFER